MIIHARKLLLQRLLVVLHLGELFLQCLLIVLLLHFGALESLNFLTLPLRLLLESPCLIFLIVGGDESFLSFNIFLAFKLLQELLMADENAVWVDYSKWKVNGTV